MHAIGSPEMCTNPKIRHEAERLKNKKELYSILDEVFSQDRRGMVRNPGGEDSIAPINSMIKPLPISDLSRNMVSEVDYGMEEAARSWEPDQDV